MERKGHIETTKAAFSLLESIGYTSAIMSYDRMVIGQWCIDCDQMKDMEMINVDAGMDNPHRDDGFWTNDDSSHYTTFGKNHTSYNHFIDLRKGAGIYDDYDGYSYGRGSGKVDQFQEASDTTDSFWEDFILTLSGNSDEKVDSLIAWWYDDEYLHSPSHEWYRDGICSPALKRYSFYEDKGRFTNVNDELGHRFDQRKGGYENHVFMPVDNLARYWYERFKQYGDSKALGFVMHGIQDCSVPHHAGGCMGNWHGSYEAYLGKRAATWYQDQAIQQQAKQLLLDWGQVDETPPLQLGFNDISKRPAINWRIDMLATWIALHAFDSYRRVYNDFRSGFSPDGGNMKELCVKALAMSALVLQKASEEKKEWALNTQNAKHRWKKIGEHFDHVYAGLNQIDNTPVIYATHFDSGDIYSFGDRGQWTKIGGKGQKFVISGMGNLYGISDESTPVDGRGVYRYNGEPNSWTKVYGPASDIFGGGAGLYITDFSNNNIYQLVNDSFVKIGGPGKTFAVSRSTVYGISNDDGVYQYNGRPDSWTRIGGNAKEIVTAGDNIFKINASAPHDIEMYNTATNRWIKIGGPGEAFAGSTSGTLAAVSPGNAGIYVYTGFPGKWRRVADRGMNICVAGKSLFTAILPGNATTTVKGRIIPIPTLRNDMQVWQLDL